VGKPKSAEQRSVLGAFAASVTKLRGGTSKKEFAARLGVEVSSLYRWEGAAGAPGLDASVLISRKLGISLNELAFGHDPLAQEVERLRFEVRELRELLRRATEGRP
jgi:transcriptional regulator with XRE-family HTH domain